MSFSGFTIQKKASQSLVKLETGASLGEERSKHRDAGNQPGEGGKDYVLSLEGNTIHRLVGDGYKAFYLRLLQYDNCIENNEDSLWTS